MAKMKFNPFNQEIIIIFVFLLLVLINGNSEKLVDIICSLFFVLTLFNLVYFIALNSKSIAKELGIKVLSV